MRNHLICCKYWVSKGKSAREGPWPAKSGIKVIISAPRGAHFLWYQTNEGLVSRDVCFIIHSPHPQLIDCCDFIKKRRRGNWKMLVAVWKHSVDYKLLGETKGPPFHFVAQQIGSRCFWQVSDCALQKTLKKQTNWCIFVPLMVNGVGSDGCYYLGIWLAGRSDWIAQVFWGEQFVYLLR